MAHPSDLPTPAFGIGLKTRLAVGAALILLLALLFLPLQAIVVGGFTQLEARTVTSNVERTLNAIADERGSLLRLTRDYAAWDDTYAFAQNGDPAYVAQNYSDASFETTRINLAIVLDRQGRVLAYRTHRLAEGGEMASDSLRDMVLSSALIRTIGTATGTTGLLVVHHTPIMLSAHPILTSSYGGPSMGTLIVGRLLDQQWVDRLGQSLQLGVSLHQLDGGPTALQGVSAAQIIQSGRPLVVALNNELVAGYALIRDSDGNPLLAVEIEQARDITAIGRQTILYTLGAFLLAALIFAITITILLNRIVLVRLDTLIRAVRTIGAERSLTQRVPLDGSDELSLLATAINQTMDSLERAEGERRAAEEQRQKMWEEVIAARRNFLATVSHELRTPLTPIRGYVDILLGGLGGELTSEQRHFLEIIRVNNKRMQALVDDLLMMGQLDAGRTELRLEQLELGEMIASSVAMFQAQIDQRQIVVSLDLPPSLPAVEADAQRLDQILANLISNAVKYTPAGGNVRIRARDSGAGRVEVAVSDNGIGMSPAELDRLFTPFYRAERVLRDQIGGTGLGLSITRSLVELHGGTIQVASEPDVGSTFSFTLAAFSANDKPQPTPGALMAYSR